MSVPGGRVCAINLLPLRQGATLEEFEKFSAELDQPTCLRQEVVEGFEAYAVRHRDPSAPSFDIVEVMTVSDWREWERVRDGLNDLKPVIEGFDKVIDGAGVRTLFGTPIPPRGS